MRFLLFLLFGLLLFGCAGNGTPEGPAGNVSGPVGGENATGMTCDEYCKSLPHIECVGEWDISGVYPGCSCEFVCETPEEEPEEIEQPEEETEGPEEPLASYTDKTLDEMLADNLAAIRSDFYRENSGSFEVKSYTLKILPGNASPGDIVFDKAPASDIKFDDKAIESIQASGFIIFTNTATEEKNTFGFVIVNELITLLDSYTGSDAFDIWYFPTVIDKDLRDCWVYEKVIEKNDKGWVSTYFYECGRVYDKE